MGGVYTHFGQEKVKISPRWGITKLNCSFIFFIGLMFQYGSASRGSSGVAK